MPNTQAKLSKIWYIVKSVGNAKWCAILLLHVVLQNDNYRYKRYNYTNHSQDDDQYKIPHHEDISFQSLEPYKT